MSSGSNWDIPLLTTSNYSDWRDNIEALLKKDGLWGRLQLWLRNSEFTLIRGTALTSLLAHKLSAKVEDAIKNEELRVSGASQGSFQNSTGGFLMCVE